MQNLEELFLGDAEKLFLRLRAAVLRHCFPQLETLKVRCAGVLGAV